VLGNRRTATVPEEVNCSLSPGTVYDSGRKAFYDREINPTQHLNELFKLFHRNPIVSYAMANAEAYRIRSQLDYADLGGDLFDTDSKVSCPNSPFTR
jgi:hypothetical protein